MIEGRDHAYTTYEHQNLAVQEQETRTLWSDPPREDPLEQALAERYSILEQQLQCQPLMTFHPVRNDRAKGELTSENATEDCERKRQCLLQGTHGGRAAWRSKMEVLAVESRMDLAESHRCVVEA